MLEQASFLAEKLEFENMLMSILIINPGVILLSVVICGIRIFFTSFRGSLRKSLRASLATDFFTSLQYGVWKSKASKSDSVVSFLPFFEAFLQKSW